MIEARRDPAIVTHGLARSFGSVVAVESLDLDVPTGELFGLVGPDGAGKSTAIRMLSGILHSTGGDGLVLGFDLRREPERIKQHIGYLSQSFTLYGDLSVDENIEFFAELHGVHAYRRRRDELLDFTRLTPFRKRLANALSGGMKKKLALACTLIHTPKIIFLDEPSTGVDPVSRGEFWNILSGILAQGVTIFMTTPYLDEAERCHHLGLMHRGRIIMTGTPAEVKGTFPGQVYRIEGAPPDRTYRVLRKSWSSTQVMRYGEHVRFWTSKGEEGARSAADWLQQQGVHGAAFKRVDPSLEDTFVALMSEKDST